MFWWITFENRSSGCAKGTEAEARALGASLGKVKSVDVLPYPASPYLNEIDHPDFCYSPNQCKGRHSCPKSYACSE